MILLRKKRNNLNKLKECEGSCVDNTSTSSLPDGSNNINTYGMGPAVPGGPDRWDNSIGKIGKINYQK